MFFLGWYPVLVGFKGGPKGSGFVWGVGWVAFLCQETREVREKAQPKVPEEQPFDGPARPAGKTTRRQQSEEEMEKRAKTRGCNVDPAGSRSNPRKGQRFN